MKNLRQRKILELIKSYDIETQEDLVNKLRESSFDVTQATVSRDIKELSLIKIATGNNKYKYFVTAEPRHNLNMNRLSKLLKDSATSIDYSDNLIVIKTLPGVANAIASCIDHIQWPEVIGTIAGDDTILLVVKPKEAVQRNLEILNKLLE
ncbi:MAG: ArgR family transcriptional regulator [Desulfitibacter sp. BRH_c19]|nr:MAG: ArgR family transcriptional regulator [Desulfitibacter sp. BRH_c19]